MATIARDGARATRANVIGRSGVARGARGARARTRRRTGARANGRTNGTDRARDAASTSEASEAAADVFIACVPLEGMERIDGAMFGERGGPAGDVALDGARETRGRRTRGGV